MKLVYSLILDTVLVLLLIAIATIIAILYHHIILIFTESEKNLFCDGTTHPLSWNLYGFLAWMPDFKKSKVR